MIRHLASEYPLSVLCEVLGVARSTVYYEAVVPPEESALLEAIETLLMRWPFYGYRRVTAQLKRAGWEVGERRVRRLLRVLEHTASVGRVRVTTTHSQHNLARFPNLLTELDITGPHQVWVADITYLRLGLRFIYLAVIPDAFTRAVRGWHLSTSLDTATLTSQALRKALACHTAPAIHHSDQGAQYAAPAYRALLPATTRISTAAAGQPTQNGLVERFIRTLKEEHVDYTEYADYDDAWRQLAHWLGVEYMTERIHSALGYLTPVEFEAACLSAPDPLLCPA